MADRILIVEDDDSLRDVLSSLLTHHGFAVLPTADVESAWVAIKHNPVDCVLADFKLKGKTGLELVERVRDIFQNLPIVMMTAYGSVDLAVEAMKLGTQDFISKPFEPERLCAVLRQVIDRKRQQTRALGCKLRRERTFMTASRRMEDILAQARKVARVESSAMILGESGTGKELLARYIHEHSPRSDKPFVAINCAALPPELLESELFGHEAGAYTGATQSRVGLFEIAAEGTIFLDEVGDMPLDIQVKLLRALQEREIKRLGGSRVIKVNPRVLSATNRSVDDLISNRRMREDFFFRIAVISFTIPPLRERPEDVRMLIEHYRNYLAEHLGKPEQSLDPTAEELLHSYPWPGNARELENVMERAVLLADTVILPEHLGIDLKIDFSAMGDASRSLQDVAEQAAKIAERELIVKTLRRTAGNKSRAAQMLGVSYKTLLNKVKLLKLEEDPEVSAPALSGADEAL